MLENDIEVRFSTKYLPFEYKLLEYRLIINKELYDEKVEKVNTHISPKGIKVAYIKLVEEEMAEELAVRIGVF